MNFAEWIESKYLEWQNSTGKRQTISKFADYLGVSRPLLSMWLNGARSPSTENVKVLAETLGAEVYDILSIPRPDPDLERLTNLWDHIPLDARKKIAKKAEEYAKENKNARKLPPVTDNL
jgi:transcriptional regulator with XRE-family HTH domain